MEGYHDQSDSVNSSGSCRKRPSRAGMRSVSTLTPQQLERKRGNDREAQRVIRQRTKDHIEGLVKRVEELDHARANSERTITALRQRNDWLEEELRRLRAAGDRVSAHCGFDNRSFNHFGQQSLSSQVHSDERSLGLAGAGLIPSLAVRSEQFGWGSTSAATHVSQVHSYSLQHSGRVEAGTSCNEIAAMRRIPFTMPLPDQLQQQWGL